MQHAFSHFALDAISHGKSRRIARVASRGYPVPFYSSLDHPCRSIFSPDNACCKPQLLFLPNEGNVPGPKFPCGPETFELLEYPRGRIGVLVPCVPGGDQDGRDSPTGGGDRSGEVGSDGLPVTRP